MLAVTGLSPHRPCLCSHSYPRFRPCPCPPPLNPHIISHLSPACPPNALHPSLSSISLTPSLPPSHPRTPHSLPPLPPSILSPHLPLEAPHPRPPYRPSAPSPPPIDRFTRSPRNSSSSPKRASAPTPLPAPTSLSPKKLSTKARRRPRKSFSTCPGSTRRAPTRSSRSASKSSSTRTARTRRACTTCPPSSPSANSLSPTSPPFPPRRRRG